MDTTYKIEAMRFITINNTAWIVLGEIKDILVNGLNHYIVKNGDEIRYYDNARQNFISVEEISEFINEMLEKKWRSESIKSQKLEYWNHILDSMRKYTRENAIRDLFDEKPDYKGVDPITFAC